MNKGLAQGPQFPGLGDEEVDMLHVSLLGSRVVEQASYIIMVAPQPPSLKLAIC